MKKLGHFLDTPIKFLKSPEGFMQRSKNRFTRFGGQYNLQFIISALPGFKQVLRGKEEDNGTKFI